MNEGTKFKYVFTDAYDQRTPGLEDAINACLKLKTQMKYYAELVIRVVETSKTNRNLTP